MTLPYATGSLYSEVDDLYLCDEALYGEKVLIASSKAKMSTPGLNGYGFNIYKRDGLTTIEHVGETDGIGTRITRDIDAKRAFFSLTQLKS